MILAVSIGHLEIVKYLAERCVNLETADKDGWTPLQIGMTTFHI